MGFVAVQHLRFGDGWIAPGDPVPVEKGRDYKSMLTFGQIERVGDAAEKPAPKAARKAAPKATPKATEKAPVEPEPEPEAKAEKPGEK